MKILVTGSEGSLMQAVIPGLQAQGHEVVGVDNFFRYGHIERKRNYELIEGDLRQTLNIILPNKKRHQLNLTSFYSSFSAIGEKLEWRMRKGVPVGLIARYNIADPEGVTKGTSYLMVAKISKTGSCVTDIVPPGAKQNEEARKLADEAISKPCKSKE